MARISSGSSEGAGAADKLGPSERGTSRCVPSELRSGSLGVRRTLRRADALGVIESEEWMSPRRFLGVLGPAGALGVLIPNQAPEKWTKRAKSLTSEIQEVRNLEADRSPFLRVFGVSS
jgi:hypothetical protein